MPVDKIKVQHKFGIISHNHRHHLLDRITAPPTPTSPRSRPTPCEISHDFISAYNKTGTFDKTKLDVQAYQLLQRVKRRAGLLSGGSGKHVHIPRAWVELSLLARCKGKFREDVLKILVGSLLTAPPSVDNIPSLFLVGETVIEWIKELGNPIPETAWSVTQILTLYVTELCFWRIYHHALLHHLQGCDSFLSDLNWHLENLDFIRKVYFKYPDGELLLRQLESTKSVISFIFPKNTDASEEKHNFLTNGMMYSLSFYQSVQSGAAPSSSLSSLLTALALLGTEDYLSTILIMKSFTLVACRNYLALQIIQAAATGTLPLQTDSETGVGFCKGHFKTWEWVIAAEFINLLVYVAIHGSSSDIQKSALKAGEMTSVRVDSDPVQGLGLLDLVAINNIQALSPAVQYTLQQGLTRVHIHVQANPLRKTSSHLIWSALQSMKNCPSHRIIVGIAQNKSACMTDVRSAIDPDSKLLFEMILDSLAEHYIPQKISEELSTPRKPTSRAPPKIPQSNISIVSKPGKVTKIPVNVRTFPQNRPMSYEERNNKILREIVADQWYKELMDVFRAAELAQKSVEQCEKYSDVVPTQAEMFIDDLDLNESEVCKVLDKLIVK